MFVNLHGLGIMNDCDIIIVKAPPHPSASIICICIAIVSGSRC
ncbi:predicted protein [Histoplasma mississippiense (nom. inval.)]|nr:predicted protein [Histoplasma mississippiense (nom. inval.)]EDN02990.1 predicted protein [Histoplasma mississippiense (nom. inval.)]